MKTSKYFCAVAVVLLFIEVSTSCITIANDKRERVYEGAFLRSNFRQIYNDDYYGFWKTVRGMADKAKLCVSVQDVSEFIDLINFGYGSAEFEEFYANVTERILVDKPECVLKALLLLKSESRKKVLDRLRSPIFESKSRIDEVFNIYKNSDEYKVIIESYFSH